MPEFIWATLFKIKGVEIEITYFESLLSGEKEADCNKKKKRETSGVG